MIAIAESATLIGVEAHLVRVEVDVANGLPSFQIVGLPDAAVRESRDRVRSAIKHSGFDFPLRRVTVNLAPGDIRKYGASFDLAIALGIVAAAGQLPAERLSAVLISGELSLDGRVLPARGVLPVTVLARRLGNRRVLVPQNNTADALVVPGAEVIGVESLADAVEVIASKMEARTLLGAITSPTLPLQTTRLSLDDIGGQTVAKRALTIAAAGGHHLLFIGPPGAGKTMLAQRLPGLLPAWSFDHALECTSIHSAAGLVPVGSGLLPMRPFRAPHHTVSSVAMVGGGRPPRAGEVSLAHRGVLFLDELPEFSLDALESLRQPLEDGRVVVTRFGHSVSFPSRFQLVAAMNPCPCGFANSRAQLCRCTDAQRHRYRARVSGPLLDRIDLVVDVERPTAHELWSAPTIRDADVRASIECARLQQAERVGTLGTAANADLDGQRVWEACRVLSTVRALVEEAAERLQLSARSVAKLLRVARTIADLAGAPDIFEGHVLEALQYRRGEGSR